VTRGLSDKRGGASSWEQLPSRAAGSVAAPS